MHYIETGSIVRIFSENDLKINSELNPETYILKFSDQIGYYLERTNVLDNKGKVYGSQESKAKRILDTFAMKTSNMGVLLVGTKGSGKTHLTRMISQNASMPTIIINSKYEDEDFLSFIRKIQTSCVLIFDEFEKLYSKPAKEQQKLLTLLDGIYSTRHLYVFTANNECDIDDLFINRPGRIYYRFDYRGLEEDFIREYCEDVLINKQHLNEIVKLSMLFNEFNFDMLQALVEEINRYNESPLQAMNYLNINPTTDKIKYDVIVKDTRTGEVLNASRFWPQNLGPTNPMTNDFNIEIYKVDRELMVAVTGKDIEDEEDRELSLRLTNRDIRNYDMNGGAYTYIPMHGFEVSLIPQRITAFDYKSLLL